MLTLSFEEIRDKTIYFVKFKNNYVLKNTLDKLPNNNTDVIDFGRESWENQPKELQEYYKAYDYAIYELDKDKYLDHPKKFYEDYMKDPSVFEPAKRLGLGLLSDYLKDKDLTKDLIVDNYDGYSLGNYHAGNYYEALLALGLDFMIVQEYEDDDYIHIIIQCDNKDNITDFEYKVKVKSLEHDRLWGDGKYYKEGT